MPSPDCNPGYAPILSSPVPLDVDYPLIFFCFIRFLRQANRNNLTWLSEQHVILTLSHKLQTHVYSCQRFPKNEHTKIESSINKNLGKSSGFAEDHFLHLFPCPGQTDAFGPFAFLSPAFCLLQKRYAFSCHMRYQNGVKNNCSMAKDKKGKNPQPLQTSINSQV